MVHFCSNQRVNEMCRLIFFLFASFGPLVYGTARCPFPGIPANARFVDNSISWQNGTSFEEGDFVRYTCSNGWKTFDNFKSYVLFCQRDGTWDRPLPQCGLVVSNKKLDVFVDQTLSRKWSHERSCSGDVSSNFYSVKVPEEFKEIAEISLQMCYPSENEIFYNSTLDTVQQCRRNVLLSHRTLLYNCVNFDPKMIGNQITAHLSRAVKMRTISVIGNTGKNCGFPPIPVHAQVVTKVVPGQTTQVTYKCSDPFQIDPNGPRQSTCDQRTGHWTALPKCICQDPNVPATAKISQREQFSLTLQCSDRLMLDPGGPQSSTCDQLTGQWTQLPRCICPNPQVPANAEIVNRTGFTASYGCRVGFTLVGKETILCDEKGTWQGNPRCICSDPPVPANAEMANRTDGSVRFRCAKGFTMIGQEMIFCSVTGHWTASPKCICQNPNVPATAEISHREDFSLTLKCKAPLILDPDGPRSSTCDQMTCQWTQLPRCICPVPVVPAKAEIVDRSGFSVRYQCVEGFTLIGKEMIFCSETGRWTAPPKCICQDPNVPATAEILHREDFSLTLKCNDQLIMEPGDYYNSTCDQVTGQWTQLPRCVCPDPDVPANAEIVNRADSSARIKCVEGFTLVGQETIHCNETGAWDELPSCQISFISIGLASSLSLPIFLLLWILALKQVCCFKPGTPKEELVDSVRNKEVEAASECNEHETPHSPEELEYEELGISRGCKEVDATNELDAYETPRCLEDVECEVLDYCNAQSGSVTFTKNVGPLREPVYGNCEDVYQTPRTLDELEYEQLDFSNAQDRSIKFTKSNPRDVEPMSEPVYGNCGYANQAMPVDEVIYGNC